MHLARVWHETRNFHNPPKCSLMTAFGLLFSTFAFVQSDDGETKNKIEKRVEVKVLGDVDSDAVTIEGDKIMMHADSTELAQSALLYF